MIATRKRRRNIIWFNPPYSINVKTNISKRFLQLVDKYFPKKHKLNKIFNRNNVKVSYSCLPNIASEITSHNKSIIRKEEIPNSPTCNCRAKNSCPLAGNCLQKNVIYKCSVKSDNTTVDADYIGLTENTFKDRLYKHRNSFKYESKANSTKLSKYVWDMKKSEKEITSMNWSIVDRAVPYKNGTKKCNL